MVEVGVRDDCYGDAAWCLADLVFAHGARLQQRCREDGGVHGEVAVAEPVIGAAVDGRAKEPGGAEPGGREPIGQLVADQRLSLIVEVGDQDPG